MEILKKTLKFSLVATLIGAVAAYFTALYQIDLYPEEITQAAIEQIGSREALIAATAAQGAVLVLITALFGYILAEKLRLMRPIRFERATLVKALTVSAVCGVVFSLDYWVFGSAEPKIQESLSAAMTLNGVLASVLYGGIVEEILMRLFFMSLTAQIIVWIGFRRSDKVPEGVFIAANVISALIFAAGHLPATVTAFGTLTPMLLFRCFLLNGGFGLVFGRLYRKYGIQYAMLSHATLHIVSKLIWAAAKG